MAAAMVASRLFSMTAFQLPATITSSCLAILQA